MANRNEYDILIDMNKELGRQQILAMVLRDLSALSYADKYKQYESMLNEFIIRTKNRIRSII